jgi:hypothetical protein
MIRIPYHPRTAFLAGALVAGLAIHGAVSDAVAQEIGDWPVHSMDRPQPPAVDPGPAPPSAPAPSDAIVLFDGSDLSQWRSQDGGEPQWRLGDGYFEVVPGTGSLVTRDSFGDVQLYVEWAAPVEIEGEGQGRGNSGVFLMGQYEVQVLDSYENPTYPDGQAGALYGAYPPLVNATRPPGEWQNYNIVFRAPRFDDGGELLQPAYVTVFHNGVLIIDNVELPGPTSHQSRPPYTAHEAELPLSLQDHGDLVRFRNIWIRELD